MTEKIAYVGKDLEAMSFAVNYHKWILDEFRPFLGKRVVEVGAGTGSFSELLLQESIDSLSLVEPSEMFESLTANVSQIKNKAQVDFYKSIFSEVATEICEKQKPDSIIYVNVLEHIEDDRLELGYIHRTLSKGGRCFIFVPALMSLYGEFDRKIGHFRRYTKREVEEKCKSAGFKILKSKYFDLAGIVPWFVKYKMLKSDSLDSGAVTLYDKVAIHFVKGMEKFVNVPLGKNVLMVAEKQ
jgi:2-polyprenyl-3-methyl-5-hydroxy-6-metoxy-1,4-benzoquinol methylase